MQAHLFLAALFVVNTAALAQAPRPRKLEGRVLDVLGDPIPAAKVTTTANGRQVGRATTDGEGIYSITLPASGGELRVDAVGKVTARLPWRGPTTPSVRNVVLEDGTAVRGRITGPDGKPAANTMVIAACRTASCTTISDEAGRYELRGVPLREVTLRAVGEPGLVECETRLTDETTLDLQLAPIAGVCRVQVHDLPPSAAGGTVRVFGPDLGALLADGKVPLGPDASARLTLRELCLVDVTLPGHVVTPSAKFAGSRIPHVDFAVQGPAPEAPRTTLRGHVRTIGGRPVEGVRVVVRDRSHCDLGEATADRNGAFQLRVVLPSDGFYRTGLALGDWLLDDSAATIVDGFAWVHPAWPQDAIDLLVDRAGTLREVVRGPNGMNFALAEVVVADTAHLHRPLVRLLSDFGGRIDLGLPPGRHEVVAIAHNGEVCCAELDVVGGLPAQPVWQRVPTGTIEGTLRDQHGAPMPGVDLFLASTTLRDEDSARASERQTSRIVTDRRGRFRCRGLPAGSWTIVAPNDERVGATEVVVVADQVLTTELLFTR